MKKLLTQTDKQTLLAFWRAALNHKGELYLMGFILVSTISINTIAPFATSNILANLVNSEEHISRYVYVLVAASLVGVIANRIGFSALMRLTAKVSKDLEKTVLDMLLRRGVSFHADNVSGKLVSDAIDYPRSYMQVQNAVGIELIPFAVNVIVGVIIISLHSLSLGVIILLMSVLVVIWAWLRSLSRAEQRVRRKNAQRKVTAHIGDSITNVITVKSFANEAYELNQNEILSTKLKKIRIKDWLEVATDGANRHAALLTMQLLFVLYLVQVASNDPALLGVSIFAFSYSVTMTNRLFQINTIIQNLENGLVEAAPMTEYLTETVEITDIPEAVELEVATATIGFDKVSFRYGDSHKDDSIFDDFSLSVKSGERIGLVGPSGGGKSTLMKLLLRFENPTTGTIKISDQDITKVTQTSLRRNVGYVSQEPLLFHRSITENITYGNPDATEEEVIQAAKKANALEFINSLPNGFDTIVGERGVKLSGGQRQRIAIARAILKNAPILLLDEATSALDSESEKYIQTALHELMKNRTSIVIAHRLSTINELDRIVVIDDGAIAEQGTHAQLLKKNGLYARLWAHQSGGFIEE